MSRHIYVQIYIKPICNQTDQVTLFVLTNKFITIYYIYLNFAYFYVSDSIAMNNINKICINKFGKYNLSK